VLVAAQAESIKHQNGERQSDEGHEDENPEVLSGDHGQHRFEQFRNSYDQQCRNRSAEDSTGRGNNNG
jgi:hypothetical protein